MKIHQISWAILLVVAAQPKPSFGQTEASSLFNPLDHSVRGIRLQGVSFFSGYYSQGMPFGADIQAANSSPSQGSDPVIGGAATFAWARSGEKSDLSITYSPSYMGRVHNTQYNSLSHRMSLNWNRKLGEKWAVSVSAGGVLANLEQLYFTPTMYSSVASTPATFDDLAAAMLAGKFTNSQLASILTGAPVVQSPEQAFLYGNRMLTATLSTSLSWSPSKRTSLSVNASGSRLEHLNSSGSTTQTAGAGSAYLVPQTTGATVSLAWSYSLTPRTQFSASVSSSRTFSRLVSGYASMANFTMGRTFSRRWFGQVTGGSGILNTVSQTIATPKNAQYLYGGSVGYKTRGYTFMASYNRSLSDVYGLGSSTTSGATGTWSWRLPGGRWSVFSNFTYQRLANLTFGSPASWLAGAGMAKALGPHVSMNLQYAYSRLPNSATLTGSGYAQNGVMLSLIWSPAAYR